MQIVIEGPDNSGKSTFIKALAMVLKNWKTHPSLGPVRSQTEFIDRYRDLCRLEYTILDRHVCVSEPIYGEFRNGGANVNQRVIDAFYSAPPILVYCRPTLAGAHRSKGNHYDTPEHIAMVEARHASICQRYDEWANNYADVFFDASETDLTAHRDIVYATRFSHKAVFRAIKCCIYDHARGVIRPNRRHRTVPQPLQDRVHRPAADAAE